jgi:hypothetical protein
MSTYVQSFDALPWSKDSTGMSEKSSAEKSAESDQSDVADGPQSAILEQVTNGVAVRMAVLWLLLSA